MKKQRLEEEDESACLRAEEDNVQCRKRVAYSVTAECNRLQCVTAQLHPSDSIPESWRSATQNRCRSATTSLVGCRSATQKLCRSATAFQNSLFLFYLLLWLVKLYTLVEFGVLGSKTISGADGGSVRPGLFLDDTVEEMINRNFNIIAMIRQHLQITTSLASTLIATRHHFSINSLKRLNIVNVNSVWQHDVHDDEEEDQPDHHDNLVHPPPPLSNPNMMTQMLKGVQDLQHRMQGMEQMQVRVQCSEDNLANFSLDMNRQFANLNQNVNLILHHLDD
ncbi:hypothetical protein LR48_Vigan10g264900 [Vigna angularis]|uniref:Uncharacterized protein n=1 Tax=Phaseolus angularis TaxID=3914 RepID=A0A0L9VPD1_PHAAN|nr:hypothetical protein LR48_Vigan10g264900 [Vigna angularis]